MPIRLDGDEEAVTYFDELLPAEKGRQRALRVAELTAIGEMAFPFPARFAGESITVLGPYRRFSPYDDPCYGAPTRDLLPLRPRHPPAG